MIDLLPTVGKKMVVRERRLRLLTVFFFVLACSLLLTAAAALPTGMLLSRYEEPSAKSAGLVDEVQRRRMDVERDLRETKGFIEHLAKTNSPAIHSSLISDLDRSAGDDVVLTHFNFDSKKKLILSGTAANRAGLSAFRDRLSAYPSFKSVELPLSSLVKDTDVPFSMTITLR